LNSAPLVGELPEGLRGKISNPFPLRGLPLNRGRVFPFYIENKAHQQIK